MKNFEQMTKKDIRQLVFNRRKSEDENTLLDCSRIITDRLTALPEFKSAKTVYTYIDFNREVSTRSIIETCFLNNKRLAVPRIDKDGMHFYEILSLTECKESAYGILEPTTNRLRVPTDMDFMIIPGVAFDSKRHRIGYGGGYYDSYLSAHPNINNCAVCFSFQLFTALPFEAFDIRPDKVITELEII